MTIPIPIPLLIIGDAPSAQSGLGRICRDLAIRIHTHCSDIFEVATLGYGGFGDKSLPFPQYHIEGMEDWLIPTLPDVWENFAGPRQGVVMTIWDASRLLWFSRSAVACPDPKLRQWLVNAPFKRWGYFPMDAVGPNGLLSYPIRETLMGYDRVLAYSKWAELMIRKSVTPDFAKKVALHALPHGIDTDVFTPRDRAQSRGVFKETLRFIGPEIRDDEKIIGIVATNQPRKDFGLAIEAISRIKDIPFRLYIQTDKLERAWSIPALLMDYGLMSKAIVNTMQVTDEVMSYIYSGCDVTLGIGLGEGFGYSTFESLACGTPHITGNYGGHAEWLEPGGITPGDWRLEGPYNAFRPVFSPWDWACCIKDQFMRPRAELVSLLPEGLAWPNLWQKWEEYFRSIIATNL